MPLTNYSSDKKDSGYGREMDTRDSPGLLLAGKIAKLSFKSLAQVTRVKRVHI